MPVEDFNGEKIFEGIANTIAASEQTTELYSNNPSFFAWILIIVAFGLPILAAILITAFFVRRMFKK